MRYLPMFLEVWKTLFLLVLLLNVAPYLGAFEGLASSMYSITSRHGHVEWVIFALSRAKVIHSLPRLALTKNPTWKAERGGGDGRTKKNSS